MANIFVAVIILSIMGLSTAKIISEKRKGVKCVGCPHSGSVKSKSSCGCNNSNVNFK